MSTHTDSHVEDDSSDDAKGHAKEKKSQATSLVEAARVTELWRTPSGETFATIDVEGRHEHHHIKSKSFKNFLGQCFYQQTQTVPAGFAVSDAIYIFEAKAMYGGEVHEAYVRIAGHATNIYIDLCNSEWNVVEVGPDGWQVISNPPVRFRRAKAMLSLPTPKSGGKLESLREFISVSDDDWPLIAGWLIGAFQPRGPYPILALLAEQGSGKSTTARLLRSLVDPNTAAIRCEPRTVQDLVIMANNGWVVSLDNLSNVSAQLSDALCRLSTGGGFSTRRLYENDEEVIFDAQRPSIVTAIEDVFTRADLLDRSVVVRLCRISESERRTEHQLLREFNDQQPYIFGGILDALVTALKNHEKIYLERLPRMADFACFVTGAEPALGWPAGTFLQAYNTNRDDANYLALEAEPIVPHLCELARRGDWRGTATDLLQSLNKIFVSKGGHRAPKEWPANARALSGIIRRIAPNLRKMGFEIEYSRAPDRHRTRMVTISRTASELEELHDPSSAASVASGLPNMATAKSGKRRKPASSGIGRRD